MRRTKLQNTKDILKFQVVFQRVITLLTWWIVFMDLAIDSRIKTSDVRIPLFHTESEVKIWDNWTHNSSGELCNDIIAQLWHFQAQQM